MSFILPEDLNTLNSNNPFETNPERTLRTFIRSSTTSAFQPLPEQTLQRTLSYIFLDLFPNAPLSKYSPNQLCSFTYDRVRQVAVNLRKTFPVDEFLAPVTALICAYERSLLNKSSVEEIVQFQAGRSNWLFIRKEIFGNLRINETIGVESQNSFEILKKLSLDYFRSGLYVKGILAAEALGRVRLGLALGEIENGISKDVNKRILKRITGEFQRDMTIWASHEMYLCDADFKFLRNRQWISNCYRKSCQNEQFEAFAAQKKAFWGDQSVLLLMNKVKKLEIEMVPREEDCSVNSEIFDGKIEVKDCSRSETPFIQIFEQKQVDFSEEAKADFSVKSFVSDKPQLSQQFSFGTQKLPVQEAPVQKVSQFSFGKEAMQQDKISFQKPEATSVFSFAKPVPAPSANQVVQQPVQASYSFQSNNLTQKPQNEVQPTLTANFNQFNPSKQTPEISNVIIQKKQEIDEPTGEDLLQIRDMVRLLQSRLLLDQILEQKVQQIHQQKLNSLVQSIRDQDTYESVETNLSMTQSQSQFNSMIHTDIQSLHKQRDLINKFWNLD